MNIKDSFLYLQKRGTKSDWSIVTRLSVERIPSLGNEDNPRYSPENECRGEVQASPN